MPEPTTPEPTTATTPTSPWTIRAEIIAKLNYAGHQNAIPFLRALSVENASGEPVSGARLVMRSDPAFLREKVWTFDRIGPQETAHVSDRDVHVAGGFLRDLQESVRGKLSLELQSAEGDVLAATSNDVELLAHNEWGGATFMPELLAAFSQPNDPAVDKILRSAGDVLQKAGKSSTIDAYESGSRERVWEIASAIYAAIVNLGLTYAYPPASFERNGQKIRVPSQILEGRVATCLDTTLLFASAFEQAGLNAVVAMPNEHALIGVWLQPEGLASVVIDEAETLRKRVDLGELILIETTFATQSPAVPFSAALGRGKQHVARDHDATFVAAVDIRQARANKIRPLAFAPDADIPVADPDSRPDGRGTPGADGTPSSDAAPAPAPAEHALEDAPLLPDFDDFGTPEPEEEKPTTPEGRIDRWQRKLLDLTARNPLLSHRFVRTSLPLYCPDPGLLEDKLAAGTKIRIVAPPKPDRNRDAVLHRQRTGEVIQAEYALAQLEKHSRVMVAPGTDRVERRSVNIYRKAQTSLQEGGANTLYLALGFLLWKRNAKDEKHFRAPLILMPVTLERKSVRSGIKMLSSDDEVRFNVTLLEMLKRDFAIDIPKLDEALPQDEHGVDVQRVWNLVRRYVRSIPGFEVSEDVVLGHFSFAKYLMWKDLAERADDLRRNDVVRHLLDTPSQRFPGRAEFADPESLDQEYKPSDLLMPLPADSSQTAAVAAADRGKDFVMIGPPGTGKSQTIANMIAHMLGKGKTVLFVSEKTAALDVVHRRLEDIGLGPYCLELHSSKARKTDFVRQLRAARETAAPKMASEWKEESDALLRHRKRLNLFVSRLHRRWQNGMTAYHAMGVKVRDEELAKRVTLKWPSADAHNADELGRLRKTVDRLAIQAEAIGSVAAHPLRFVTRSAWSPPWQSEIGDAARRIARSATRLDNAQAEARAAVGFDLPDASVVRLRAFGDLARLLVESYGKANAFALEPGGDETVEILREASRRLARYRELQSSLSGNYDPFAWRKLDGIEIGRRWRQATSAGWIGSWSQKRKIKKELRAHLAPGRLDPKHDPDPERDAPVLADLRVEGEALDRIDKRLQSLRQWHGHGTQPAVMEELHKLGARTRAVTEAIASDPQTLISVRGKVLTLLRDGNDLLAPHASVGKPLAGFVKAMDAFESACAKFETLADGSFLDATGLSLDQVAARAAQACKHLQELRDWCSWQLRRQEAEDLGLLPLVNALERGRIPADKAEINRTFEAAYCTWWSEAVIGEDEVLRSFSTPEHEAEIEKFRATDERYLKATADYIAAKIAGTLRERTEDQAGWPVIRRQMQRQRGHMPIRQMLGHGPDAVMSMMPCFMMSPLSVAQYLAPDQQPFDVVIFDEASQITVWDAIGSLARGKQVIVAGDPKQMPPTNFFKRSEDDPDGEIDVEGDLESILEEMMGAGIPFLKLNLHYRSQKEGLIAFSNTRYYDESLITFPSPAVSDHGVSLEAVEGHYARGRGRHNEGEADAIVEEIVRRLTHPDDRIRMRSIGVVTFNIPQQRLIEDLLDEERRKDPSIEWAFSRDQTLEPVFVKNLETVQGDERDVILFSVTYGPDAVGHVTMNFGPLNREGGQRRLNVAITRSRVRMMVFSALRPDQIDLSRTAAHAVADLKHFLEFAQNGPRALRSANFGPVGDFESPFEEAVAKALRSENWIVQPQIGVSSFRVDLGIVHPDARGRYLAGVECDGAMYHSSAVARERDKVRQQVLEGLGWTIFRIWSTDWWTNKSGALAKIDDQLRQHLIGDRRDGNGEAGAEDDASDQRDAGDQGAGNRRNDHPDVGRGEGKSAQAGLESTAQDSAWVSPEPGESPEPQRSAKVPERYEIAQLTGPEFEPDSSMFYDHEYEPRLDAMVAHVIDVEGPIHETVLVRRIANHHGFKRAGRLIRECVTSSAESLRESTQDQAGTFYWPDSETGERLVPARVRGRDSETRDPRKICDEEICAIDAALDLRGHADSIARALGAKRVTRVSRDRIERALGSCGPPESMHGTDWGHSW